MPKHLLKLKSMSQPVEIGLYRGHGNQVVAINGLWTIRALPSHQSKLF